MYTLEDLFDRRSPVGTRLEQILMEKKCTKAELSKKTGVSRPTIDKVLSGTITSKKNYETHMSKIMNYLQITPDTGCICRVKHPLCFYYFYYTVLLLTLQMSCSKCKPACSPSTFSYTGSFRVSFI